MRKNLLINLGEEYYLDNNFYPLFSPSSCSFIRDENHGYATINSNTKINLKELIINPTGKKILKLCDGETTIKDIVSVLSNEYKNVNEDLIYRDVINVLFDFTNIEILTWKGCNPFMIDIEEKIGDYTLKFATENDIKDIISFVKKEDSEIKYEPISLACACAKDELETHLRSVLFSLLEDIFIAKKDGEIVGILNITIPQQMTSTASTITNIQSSKEATSTLLKYATDKLKSISIVEFTKVVILLNEDDESQIKLKEHLKESGFKEECRLENEYKNSTVVRYAYIY